MGRSFQKMICIALAVTALAVVPEFSVRADSSNTTRETAKVIETNATVTDTITSYGGMVSPQTDPGWYRFVLPKDGYVTFSGSFESTYYSTLTVFLYDAEEREIKRQNKEYSIDNNNGEKKEFETQTPIGLAAGTYYVKIEAKLVGGDCTYDFNVHFTASGVWEKEYNDTLETATLVPLNAERAARLASVADEDYYKFTLDRTSYVSVSFNTNYIDNSMARILVYLADENGDSLCYTTLGDVDTYMQVFANRGENAEAVTGSQILLAPGTYYMLAKDLGFTIGFNYQVIEYSFTINTEPMSYVAGGIDYAPVFDIDFFGQNNADIKQYYEDDQTAMFEHFVNYGMAEGRQGNADFNVYLYMSNYPDLVNVFGSDLKSYYLHYIQYGKAEGRVANVDLNAQSGNAGNGGNAGSGLNAADYADVFDAQFYYNTYADLREYIGNDPDALLAHFVTGGMAEGRQGNDEFHVQIYQTKYDDLAEVFGDNLQAYYLHYMNSGKAEGRTANPNIYSRVYNYEYYLQANSDLTAVFADNKVAAFNHFLNAGMVEKRVASSEFNVTVYMENNPDLVSAYGDNTKMYYLHYMDGGYAEPRIAH